MRSRRIRWLVWSLWGLTMALEITAIWLWLDNRRLGGGYAAPQVFIVPGFATVGAVIAARRANRVGWLFVSLGFVAALQAFSMAYAARDRLVDPGVLPASSLIGPLEGWLWPLNYLLFFLIMLLFPDGRLPSPRWRPAARFILVAWGLSILLNMLGPSEGNPLFVSTLLQRAWQLVVQAVNTAALAGIGVAALAPFLRYRRASYQQRQQLKWVAFTVAVSVLSVLVSLGLGQLLPGVEVIGVLGGLVFFGGIAIGIPLAVAVAILRHRLYDIDRLINRTLVYGLLTAVLGLAYAGAVLVLGELFGGVAGNPPSWQWPAPPWPRRRCSSRPVAASSRSWIGTSTGASTMRPRPRRPSVPVCGTRSIWMPSRPSCWRWPTRRCSQQRRPCGCDPQHRSGRVVKDTEAELNPTGLTPCMPCRFGLLLRPRSDTCAQPNGRLRVTVTVRYLPLVTAAYGTRVARPARTTIVPLAPAR